MFCPRHLMTDEPCLSGCEKLRAAFTKAVADMDRYFQTQYGRPQPVERIIGNVCPGCGGRTYGGRRRYHGLECRNAARRAGKAAA